MGWDEAKKSLYVSHRLLPALDHACSFKYGNEELDSSM